MEEKNFSIGSKELSELTPHQQDCPQQETEMIVEYFAVFTPIEISFNQSYVTNLRKKVALKDLQRVSHLKNDSN